MRKLVALLIIFIPLIASAQWRSDPSENKIVFSGNNSDNWRIGHTLQTCSDGSVFFTWYNPDTVLNVTLMNSDGYVKWDKPIIRINHPKNYGLYSLIDMQDNLYIWHTKSYPNIWGYDLIIHKVTAQGDLSWGTEGIVIPNPKGRFNVTPTTLITNEYGDLLLYTGKSTEDESYHVIYKLDQAGNFLWGEDGLILNDLDYPYQYVNKIIMPTSQDEIYLLYTKSTGAYGCYEVYVRKYNSNGEKCWTKDPMIYNGWTGLNGVKVLKGSHDDFYFTCYSPIIQHINPDGSFSWEGGGVCLDDPSNRFAKPEFKGINSKGQLLVHYNKLLKDQGEYQLFAQIINENGIQLWPDGGNPVEIPDLKGHDLGSDFSSKYITRLTKDTMAVLYKYPVDSTINELRVFFMDFYQNPIFDNPITISPQEYHSYINFSSFKMDQAVISWTTGNDTIQNVVKAQNLHFDGTLGIRSTSIKETPKTINLFIGYDPLARTLRFSDSELQGQYSLLNISGQIIDFGVIKKVVSLPELPDGIYILKIQYGDHFESHKLIF